MLCFGLLYHLENPFAAVRNLASLTARALLIETMIAPGDDALAVLLDEFRGQDQGLRQLALIPTQTCLVKMLHRAGFAHVYQASQLPDHPDYRASGAEYQKRTVLIALRNTCNTVKLLPCADHRIRWDACWKKA
ncbi:MAG: hypothetical protein HC898_11065 [Phycisphaerales bacterium]|nr:hypothetical protein [Phycisphaerales bacterium]